MLRRTAAVLLIVCQAGCAAPEVAVYNETNRPWSEVETYLYEAADHLEAGLTFFDAWEDRDYAWAPLQMALSEDWSPDHSGLAFAGTPCGRVMIAQPDPEVIAHELGHVLGLPHVIDRDNVMFHNPGHEFTRDQLDTVHQGMLRIGRCVAR